MKTTEKKKSGDNVIELEAVKEEIEAIRHEALIYGIAMPEDKSLAELRMAIRKIRLERKNKPPCYLRSYMSTAPQCRVCDLNERCAKPDLVAPYMPPEDLLAVTCAKCKTGSLTIECCHPETGDVLDYGCSTPGCTQTLTQQTQYKPPKIEKKTKKSRSKTKSGRLSTEALDEAILDFIEKRKGVKTKKSMHSEIPADKNRINARIDELVKTKRLKYKKYIGYFLPEAMPHWP